MSRSQSRRPRSDKPGACRFEQPERKGARALERQGTDAFSSKVKGTNPLAREAILSSALCFFTACSPRLLAMRQELKRVLFEALVVFTAGLVFALVANLASPRGLSLTRNYFPGPNTSEIGPGANSNLTVTAQKTDPVSHATWETVSARLRGKGLQPIDSKEAIELFRDPQYEQEMTVFVDARDDRHYQEGHVPGAYQFDRYYPEKHLPAVLPACLNATKVVVYCAGGDCEDSEFAALALKEAGVPQEHLFIYASGMTEWATNGVPVELGERKSGNLRPAKP